MQENNNLQQEYLFDSDTGNNLQLSITNYEGPLDLLLALVKENKIEIKDIFVSQVTEQFLQYMSQLSEVDVDKASEYMAIAATLLEIKSRALLPILPGLNDEDTPEQTLIRQLEEYQMFKEVCTELKVQENVNRFYRAPDDSVGTEVLVAKDNLSIDGFMEAFQKIMMRLQTRSETENVSRAIQKENFSVPQKVQFIKQHLINESQVNFASLFTEKSTSNEIVTTFIAVLELLKLQLVLVHQNELFDDIIIERRPDVVFTDDELETNYDTIG